MKELFKTCLTLFLASLLLALSPFLVRYWDSVKCTEQSSAVIIRYDKWHDSEVIGDCSSMEHTTFSTDFNTGETQEITCVGCFGEVGDIVTISFDPNNKNHAYISETGSNHRLNPIEKSARYKLFVACMVLLGCGLIYELILQRAIIKENEGDKK